MTQNMYFVFKAFVCLFLYSKCWTNNLFAFLIWWLFSFSFWTESYKHLFVLKAAASDLMYPSLNDNVSLLLIFSSDCFSPLSPNMICTTFRKLSSCGFESSSVSRLHEYFWRSTGLLMSGPFSNLKRQQPWHSCTPWESRCNTLDP